jgi:hypothetical protein
MVGVEAADMITLKPIVVRRHSLLGEVVRVEAKALTGHLERMRGLTRRHPTQLWYPKLDDEATTSLKVRGSISETRNLFRLRQEVADRVEH